MSQRRDKLMFCLQPALLEGRKNGEKAEMRKFSAPSGPIESRSGTRLVSDATSWQNSKTRVQRISSEAHLSPRLRVPTTTPTTGRVDLGPEFKMDQFTHAIESRLVLFRRRATLGSRLIATHRLHWVPPVGTRALPSACSFRRRSTRVGLFACGPGRWNI